MILDYMLYFQNMLYRLVVAYNLELLAALFGFPLEINIIQIDW